MKSKSTLLFLSILLLVLMIGFPTAQAQIRDLNQGENPMDPTIRPLPVPDDDDDEFNDDVAGSYLVDIDVQGFGPARGLQTLTADGGLVSTDTSSFGAQGTLNSPGHGAWRRSGSSEITSTALIFIFDPTGQHVITANPRGVLVFDDDFETATGTLDTSLFFPSQDPLDPEETPFAVFPGTVSYRRIANDDDESTDE